MRVIKHGNLIYAAGAKRADLIRNLPVVLLDGDRETASIESLGQLYSQEWLKEM